MKVQVKPWGNSQGIRLPKEILEDAKIAMDEFLNIEVKSGIIILSKSFQHKTLEERAEEFDGKLNFDEEYDWGEAVGREVW